MIRAFIFAASLLLAGCGGAMAQGCGVTNPSCIVPTAPAGTSNNQAASTAFVQGAVVTLPLASGKIYVGSAGGVAVGQTVSGDCTLVVNGTITCTKLNSVSPGTLFPLGAGTGLGISGSNLNLQPASASIIGGVESITCATHQWLNTISVTGVPACSQPGFSDLSGNISFAQLGVLGTLPTTQTFASGTNATYTTPSNVLWIEIYEWGGGGGGTGGGSGGGSGTAGNGTCWAGSGTACSSPLLEAGGGAAGGTSGPVGGSGGAVSGSLTCNASHAGGIGQGIGNGGSTSPGASGGVAPGIGVIAWGAAPNNNAATAAPANSGAGGGGGSTSATLIGNGGGGGAYCYAIIKNPAASYVYTIGASAAGGAGGTSGGTGGASGSGYLYVVEHYGS